LSVRLAQDVSALRVQDAQDRDRGAGFGRGRGGRYGVAVEKKPRSGGIPVGCLPATTGNEIDVQGLRRGFELASVTIHKNGTVVSAAGERVVMASKSRVGGRFV